MNLTLNFVSLLGIFGLCFIAWLTSENRQKIPWSVIRWGLSLQLLIGLLVFIVPFTRQGILVLNDGMTIIMDASEKGASFLFGRVLANTSLWPAKPTAPKIGYVFAFRALPQVIFFSAIISLMYRMNVIQPIVKVFARFFQRTMGISGAESLAGSANIFVGIESVIAIKPFLKNLTRSEICSILANCFGSIASTVLAIYASFLKPTFPNIVGHMMSASILTIPACFVISKIVIPETGKPLTMGSLPEEEESSDEKKGSYMDALIKGAIDGVQIAVGIAAVIIAILGVVALSDEIFKRSAASTGGIIKLVAFIAMSLLLALKKDKPRYYTLSVLCGFIAVWVASGYLFPASETGGGESVFSFLTVDNILGALFFPLTCLTGVSLDIGEIWMTSKLIGMRLLKTSVPPYVMLGQIMKLPAEDRVLTERAMLIISYVLCGFAHIPSMGIFIGGFSNLVPEKAHDISSVAWKALWAATLGTLMTGCIAGLYDLGNYANVLGVTK
ncbi:MAG: nucleoside transporter C-terminal domain-containing protein [Spirochaetota bacterium]